MANKISDRVSTAIKKSPFSNAEIGREVGVSESTVWRWESGKTEKFKERQLKALAKKLQISYNWLQFGKGSITNTDDLTEIESAVNEKGEDYKGLDQTILDVELRVKSLIQDLKSLLVELDDLNR